MPSNSAEYMRDYRARNHERLKAKDKAWQRANLLRIRLVRHGLTVAQYEELLKKQEGLCATCRQPPKGRDNQGNPMPLVIDHCHSSKRVRGLLCTDCNRALGLIRDNPAVARALAEYLEK